MVSLKAPTCHFLQIGAALLSGGVRPPAAVAAQVRRARTREIHEHTGPSLFTRIHRLTAGEGSGLHRCRHSTTKLSEMKVSLFVCVNGLNDRHGDMLVQES